MKVCLPESPFPPLRTLFPLLVNYMTELKMPSIPSMVEQKLSKLAKKAMRKLMVLSSALAFRQLKVASLETFSILDPTGFHSLETLSCTLLSSWAWQLLVGLFLFSS